MESIYAETKRQWEFYKPASLEQEITSTKEAQRHIKDNIQATVQEIENAVASLQVADGGNCYITHIYLSLIHI